MIQWCRFVCFNDNNNKDVLRYLFRLGKPYNINEFFETYDNAEHEIDPKYLFNKEIPFISARNEK